MEAFLTDCGVAGDRCCRTIRELRWFGMERFELGVRGTLLNEPGKSWPLTPDMEAREVGAFEAVSVACTTKRRDGNIVARAIAIEVDCAPTWTSGGTQCQSGGGAG